MDAIPDFEAAWERRIAGRYGDAPANWIDLDCLLAIRNAMDSPRHQEDARILRQVRDREHPSGNVPDA